MSHVDGAGQTPRGGRRWLAVLVVSAALAILTGSQWLLPREFGAEVQRVSVLDPAVVPSTAASAPPGRGDGAAPSTPTGQPGGHHDTRPTGWATRRAVPPAADTSVQPKRLIVSTVGLDLPVVASGVGDDGQMALPDRPTSVGWYRFGAAPGDGRGATVLAGHLDSARYGAGPLERLAELRPGASVVVVGADGTRRSYLVDAVQRLSKVALPTAEIFDRTGPPVLRLVTCGGEYDPGRGGYQDNLIVTARPR